MQKGQRGLLRIAVTSEVYEELSNMGKFGESFNDVVKRLLDERKIKK